MKRFTETDKWKDKWFRQLPAQYKLIWMYLLDNCDNAGVFDADWQLIGFFVGFLEIDERAVLEVFKDRITRISPDAYIINKFIEFQYGNLNLSCPPHLKVLRCLKKAGLCDFTVKHVLIKGQERSQYTNIDATAYGTLLGRVLGMVPSRVHGRAMEEEEEEEEEVEKEKEGKREKEAEKEKAPKPEVVSDNMFQVLARYKSIRDHQHGSNSIKKFETKLKGHLKRRTLDELLLAIDNYRAALQSGKVTYVWDVWEFVGHEKAEKYYQENFKPNNFKNMSKPQSASQANMRVAQNLGLNLVQEDDDLWKI